jgi:hypothetical protein
MKANESLSINRGCEKQISTEFKIPKLFCHCCFSPSRWLWIYYFVWQMWRKKPRLVYTNLEKNNQIIVIKIKKHEIDLKISKLWVVLGTLVGHSCIIQGLKDALKCGEGPSNCEQVSFSNCQCHEIGRILNF